MLCAVVWSGVERRDWKENKNLKDVIEYEKVLVYLRKTEKTVGESGVHCQELTKVR